MKRRLKSTGLSAAGAEKLRPRLDAFLSSADVQARIAFDPIELPRRYDDPRDIEVSALLSACLAYGRADLFKPKLERLHLAMGRSPARFVRELDVEKAAKLLDGFVYRFNLGADIAVLWLGMGRALRERGSLEQVFLDGLEASGSLHGALAHFTALVREVPMKEIRRTIGNDRGLHHLLPSPLGTGAAKRLNLYLRWMVRGPDEVDFGIWKRVPKSVLMIPLDTHIGRISKHLGLTKRNDLSWRTAEEITTSLRRIDPDDPVKYDFALCHYGMSGVCPTKPKAENCARCELLTVCRVGPRVVRRDS